MASSPELCVKLLVDTKSNKVLFAEAGKEFVDFIFDLLTVPLGCVVKLMSNGGMHGSIGRLYESVDGFPTSYLQPNVCKSELLQPKMRPVVDGGHVKATETYIVTDGLNVTPMTTISASTLINRFALHKDTELAEKVVGFGMNEAMALLTAVMGSDTVLSDVYLAKKK
ncbi:uncharacterized protein LOC119350101 [Triticum dicoccoides]|uniref:uncharacterized protein LOC119350101 n=1 Tax=Triticum dicoccoides TaxID=85692 RepID=UPI00188F8239|nr:uncharacterized protein LOC119350101 [Triticum dicoccoides]